MQDRATIDIAHIIYLHFTEAQRLYLQYFIVICRCILSYSEVEVRPIIYTNPYNYTCFFPGVYTKSCVVRLTAFSLIVYIISTTIDDPVWLREVRLTTHTAHYTRDAISTLYGINMFLLPRNSS